MNIPELSFIVLAALIFYVYIGYPALLLVVSSFYSMKRKIDEKYEPRVTLLIAAYNEKGYIDKKIENSLELDYPKSKLEIIVFSDGSDDGTDDVVKTYEDKGVTLIRIEGRKGKTICQNESVKKATGEIIIFTDTKAILDKKVVKKIVRHYADGKVGSVLGRLIYKNDKSNIKEGAYWRLEQWIKSTESRLFGSVSGTGALYSLRKKDYVNLPNFALSDFAEPLAVMIEHGGVPVTDPEAIAYNLAAGSSTKEIARHERIITRYLFNRRVIRDAYNPFKFGLFSIGLISHKSMRFYAPFLLIAAFFLNFYLYYSVNELWGVALMLQEAFYVFALVGFVLDRAGKGFFLFSIPYHFVVLNISALKAWYNYLRGKNFVTWNLKGK